MKTPKKPHDRRKGPLPTAKHQGRITSSDPTVNWLLATPSVGHTLWALDQMPGDYVGRIQQAAYTISHEGVEGDPDVDMDFMVALKTAIVTDMLTYGPPAPPQPFDESDPYLVRLLATETLEEMEQAYEHFRTTPGPGCRNGVGEMTKRISAHMRAKGMFTSCCQCGWEKADGRPHPEACHPCP